MLSFFSNTFVKEPVLIIYLKLHMLFVLPRQDKLDVHAYLQEVCGSHYAAHVAELKSLVKL